MQKSSLQNSLTGIEVWGPHGGSKEYVSLCFWHNLCEVFHVWSLSTELDLGDTPVDVRRVL